MNTRYEHKGLVWVDLESPTRVEVQRIVNEFGIDPIVAEEMLMPSTKPRTEIGDNYIFMILHFPALRHTHKSREQEIDFVLGHNFLITTRYDTIDPLHKFSKQFEVSSLLEKNDIRGDHAAFILFAMLRTLYRAVEHETEYVRHDLTVIEEHVFRGEEVRMVEAISRSARDLLNIRQTIEPHRDVLRALELDTKHFFDESFDPYLKTMSNEYYRVHNHVMRSTEILHELRETNNSLLTTKQNETMKVFTVMAFITFPLSLIATVLGLQAVHNPILGRPFDFEIILAIMFAASIAMGLYFKYKKWI